MKISFCTTCMNRLFHLKQVVLKNIKSSLKFNNVEFVLLNYGSKDELDEWTKQNLSDYIKSGRLSYYKTNEPKYWAAAHAKNIAHKLASGDVLCNLDSDILIPDRFCEYIDAFFTAKPNSIMAFDSEDIYRNHGCAGIIATKKENFYSVNGYDENINLGWGCDDMNFQFRCRMKNSLELFVPPKICMCIPHSNNIRTANCKIKQIEKTRRLSIDICEDVANKKDYVANKSNLWGKAKVFKNFSEKVIQV